MHREKWRKLQKRPNNLEILLTHFSPWPRMFSSGVWTWKIHKKRHSTNIKHGKLLGISLQISCILHSSFRNIWGSLKGTLTRKTLAFFHHLPYYISICLVYADGFKILLLSDYFNINTHLAKCFRIHQPLTEQARKPLKRVLWTHLDYCPRVPWTHLDYCMSVPWTRLKTSKRVLLTARKCYCPHACSGNMCKKAQACSVKTFATYVQACSRNTHEWFLSVFSETFENYEAFC
jgi:hypothetical protein